MAGIEDEDDGEVEVEKYEGSMYDRGSRQTGRQAQMMARFCSIMVQMEESMSKVMSGLVDEKLSVVIRRIEVIVVNRPSAKTPINASFWLVGR